MAKKGTRLTHLSLVPPLHWIDDFEPSQNETKLPKAVVYTEKKPRAQP